MSGRAILSNQAAYSGSPRGPQMIGPTSEPQQSRRPRGRRVRTMTRRDKLNDALDAVLRGHDRRAKRLGGWRQSRCSRQPDVSSCKSLSFGGRVRAERLVEKLQP